MEPERSVNPAPAKVAGSRGPYARGVRRRRQLLQAVLRIIAREGVAAITHRAVAAEAGTSLRATTYYFTSKEDMIRRAFRFFVSRSLERIEVMARELSADGTEPSAAVNLIIEQILQESSDPDTSWAAEFELVLAIAREPSFAPEYREFQLQLDRLVQQAMVHFQSSDPAADARIVLGFLRGFELKWLSQPNRPVSSLTVKEDLTRLLHALLGVPA